MINIKKIINNIYFLFFIILIFFIRLPIINIIDLFYFLIIILLFFSMTNQKKQINFLIIMILILCFFIVNKYLNNNYIKESHGIFLPNNQNINLYLNENHNIFSFLIKEFNNSYSKNDLICEQRYLDAKCWKDIKIENIYSKSFDKIDFKNNNYSRKINSINYKNFSESRIGSINSLRYNWFTNPDTWFDKKAENKIKRINPPYIIKYEFENNAFENSQFCFKGNAIIYNKKNRNYINLNNKETNCLYIKSEQEIIFYNFNNNLEVKLKKSINLIVEQYSVNLIKLIILIIILYLTIGKINLTRFVDCLFIISISSIIIFYNIYTRSEFSFGYAPLQGGMDGIAHEGFGRIIYENFLNFNFYEVFRGGESIYWFMPGLRYFAALNKFLFGDTQFGLYLLLIFFPILFYFFFLNFFSRKISLFIISIFILIKIPHLGFSFSHYVINMLTLYPETLAIIMFLISMLFMLQKNYIMFGICASLMVFLRPNFLPVYAFMNFYSFIILTEQKRLKNLFFLFIGSSVILVIPIHNYYFGKALVLFVNIDDTFTLLPTNRKDVPLSDYVSLIYSLENLNKISNHLLNFLTTGMKNEIVYIINSIFLFNLFIYFIINFYKFKYQSVFFCYLAILQITPSLFHANTGRYVHFSWMLITIANLFILKEYIRIIKRWWVRQGLNL
tara:strand:+ start:18224 stop:20245 length:2022 start_codon:yes stop_codon:yes gene_type:complete